MALYGPDPPFVLCIGKGQTSADSLEEMLQERESILDDLPFNLLKTQKLMKLAANLHRRDVVFVEGEHVYLKLQPYRQKSIARRSFKNLAASFYEPFPVIQRIGEVAYKLELPPGSKIHPVFTYRKRRESWEMYKSPQLYLNIFQQTWNGWQNLRKYLR
ncbi:hypothetical protein AgCh_013592 [Apium graveolens]